MEWGTPVWWGWFLLFSRSGGHKTKETYPTRPGYPTPCKQGLNRVMLNGDDNENGFKTNRSNQQKTNCTCSTLFLLISKKQICTCSTPFCLSLAVVCTTTTSNFLVTHYFYGGIVVCVYPIFCFLCSCSLLFFTAAHFHLAGRQHFSFSHRRFEFSCFSPYEIRLLCFR